MGKKVIYVPTCHSTNLLAEQVLADKGNYEGTVVITDHQTMGRGQFDREWETEPGKNLTLSVILKPSFLHLESQFLLNMFSSLAVKKTVSFLAGYSEIKWPNDILINNRKISGILIKNVLKGKTITNSILGIGLNVNQEKFTNENAASLRGMTRKQHDLSVVFSSLMENLESYYLKLRESKCKVLENEYHNSLFGLEKEIHFESEGEFKGIIKGVDKKGQLIVEVSGKNQKFNLNQIKIHSKGWLGEK
jgi:BirA family biotin operon repressor/biotin-[acetyl-CoA-carboxylase] ligase